MKVNIFGKFFQLSLLFLVLIELISLLSYVLSPLNQVVFFIILGAALVLSLIKLEYGLLIILAELFVGGKGQLFALDIDGTIISIRMGLFLIVLGVWLTKKIQSSKFKVQNSKFKSKYLILSYALLFIAIAWGAVNGLANHEFSKVFFDFNAWIYFGLILVFFDLIKNQKIIQNILQVLTAATSYLAAKTVAVLFLFSHDIVGTGGVFYKWIRDTGVGEITYVSGTIFRVFLQSQIYLLIGFFIILAILASQSKNQTKKINIYLGIYLYLVSLALIISQSRSFWVGGIVALFLFVILAIWKFDFKIKQTIGSITLLLAMFTSQIFLIQIITNNFAGNLVSSRFDNLQTEAASLSRLNQLEPLSFNILQQSIFGYGFGKELTYVSTDPRIIQTHPGGVYTTYAFEWGYLDIWLKFGLLGLVAYLFLISLIIFQSIKKPTALNIGLLLGLMALIFTNIFSPYLNHPLGIGYIMLMSVMVKD